MSDARRNNSEEERLLYRVRSRVEMARTALSRVLMVAMGKLTPHERPRFCIPRREDDDDAILEDVIDALPILLAAYDKRAADEPEAKACSKCNGTGLTSEEDRKGGFVPCDACATPKIPVDKIVCCKHFRAALDKGVLTPSGWMCLDCLAAELAPEEEKLAHAGTCALVTNIGGSCNCGAS